MKYLIVALGVLLTSAAQVLVKTTSLYDVWSKKFILFIGAAMVVYCVAFLVQSYLMRLFPLSRVGPAMAIATMIVVFICGVIFFGEGISMKQIIGILLGGVSIYLILY